MLRFAIVGCGRIAKRHSELLGFDKIKNASLVSVCDINENKARKIGQQFNIPHYIYDSSSSGKVVLLHERPDLYNFPMRKFYFNHTVFSNTILFSKILNNQYTYVDGNELQNSSIYPMTGVGRIIFIINSEKEYYKKKLPNIFNNQLYLFYIIYICTIIFVIIIFIMTLLNIMRILYKK